MGNLKPAPKHVRTAIHCANPAQPMAQRKAALAVKPLRTASTRVQVKGVPAKTDTTTMMKLEDQLDVECVIAIA